MGNKATAVIKVLTFQHDSPNNQRQQVEKRQTAAMVPSFSAALPRPLQVGDKIELEVKVADDAELFTVNLTYEEEDHMNVAYHHKIMFPENKIVLNSKYNGRWLDEIHNTEMHVGPGETFTMFLLMTERNKVTAYFNGMHHSDYDSQIDMEGVKYVQIWHGLDKIKSIKFSFAD